MSKNIVITGGSSGIGKGIAKYFFSKGYQVLITGRNLEKLERIGTEMPGISTLQYDNANEHDHLKITTFIKERWNGKLHILVNNAGIVQLSELGAINLESMETMFRSHVFGPSILASACLPFLEAAKGQILNITSSVGIKPYAQTSAYGSAKAALNMLTKIWALELAPKGIRVNAIAPGPTETGILKSSGLDDEMVKAIHEAERAAIPLQRRGYVDDIVASAVMLLDSWSDWTTGIVLPADGGVSIS
ncbi:SDR family NAD(P)-dependent oxidoreductase [Chitinophaga sp. GCM10012297]|uniref:SDR family oxidoreductase n=1 Tax=Chitinophaga chungangae TaxID=2821488 RepID=A0ABS3Y9L0_9BACT|nr:SDR family oxidoreductase [Chitinophaga chungangae]MBO9151336.1 SDR family oxidoreductase [Chitinophaga chungangae]